MHSRPCEIFSCRKWLRVQLIRELCVAGISWGIKQTIAIEVGRNIHIVGVVDGQTCSIQLRFGVDSVWIVLRPKYFDPTFHVAGE
jgi:hypothetical protein